MSDSKHNNPPFAVLELNQVEHEYLTKLMDRAHGQAKELFVPILCVWVPFNLLLGVAILRR